MVLVEILRFAKSDSYFTCHKGYIFLLFYAGAIPSHTQTRGGEGDCVQKQRTAGVQSAGVYKKTKSGTNWRQCSSTFRIVCTYIQTQQRYYKN